MRRMAGISSQIMRAIGTYIHQLPEWPAFTWDPAALEALLGAVRHQQGRLLGRLEALGGDLRRGHPAHAHARRA